MMKLHLKLSKENPSLSALSLLRLVILEWNKYSKHSIQIEWFSDKICIFQWILNLFSTHHSTNNEHSAVNTQLPKCGISFNEKDFFEISSSSWLMAHSSIENQMFILEILSSISCHRITLRNVNGVIKL